MLSPTFPLLALAGALLPSVYASLFGSDTLGPVRAAIGTTERHRQEVQGWYHHNETQQGNWSFNPNPADLHPVLPAYAPDRNLVDSDGAYYNNITGFYKGEWSGWDVSTAVNRSLAVNTRLNATAAQRKDANTAAPVYLPGINGSVLLNDRGSFDWFANSAGKINFQLREEHILPGNVSLVKGNLGIEGAAGSPNSPQTLDFTLEGLHFIPTGALFLLGVGDESEKSNDVRDVLAMIPLEHSRSANMTVAAIDQAFAVRLNMLQDIIASGSYDGGDDSNAEAAKPTHNCTLHLYGQMQSAGQQTGLQESVITLEHEMEHSTGIPTISAPQLSLHLTAYSPDCHLLISAPKIHGLLETKLWKKAVRYAVIYLIVLLIQTRLLVQQMEVTRTPSGLNKVSYRTFVAQSILDAYGCLAHLSIAVALENETTMPLMACAFMSAVCFLAFGYRYTLTIFRNQIESAPSTTMPPLPTAAAAEDVPSAATDPTAPTPPNTGPNTDEAPVLPETVEARRRGGTMFAFGAFLFMSAFFPLLTSAVMVPVLYSFWLPQIHRNIQRGTRRAIQKRSVIGTTLCRLFVPLYIFACPDNVLFFDPNGWVWALVVYVVLQAMVLLGQDLFGSHFFLPASWIPASAVTAWDWHPPVQPKDDADPEVDAMTSLGDCAICLNAIEPKERSAARRRRKVETRRGYESVATTDDESASHLYPPEKGRDGAPALRRSKSGSTWRTWLARAIRSSLRWQKELGASNTFRRKRSEIMVAPCHHVFHTQCLERWLTIKTECPSCRSPLPPV